MRLVAMSLQITMKLFNFHNKARQNALVSPYKQGQIFVEKDIFQICYPMAAQGWK